MSKIIAGRFDKTLDADAAVEALQREGFNGAEIDSFYVAPPGQNDMTPVGGDAPSSSEGSRDAGMGAVIGAHCFLNTVTSAITRPPIAPPQTYGITAPGLPAAIAAENCDQVNSAPTSVSTSSIAVLLTVPLMVIAGGMPRSV